MEALTVKPWGHCVDIFRSEKCTLKTITINPGQRTSLQRHEHRREAWTVLAGSGIATLDSVVSRITVNCTVYVDFNQSHRITNDSKETPLIIAEIQSGFCREDDIERMDDDYGRAEDE